jgi:glycosyltransferase involved in cell wall biosynthesis
LSIIEKGEVKRRLEEIGEAEILVGIPSYNNATTIGHVVRAVQVGFAKYFPDVKCVIVNSDGGSTDGTMEIVKNTTLENPYSILLSHRTGQFFKIATPYHGIPGKGSAFKAIFEIATAIKAKACAVVDSDLRSITPEWIELLIKPVIEGGYAYVSPLYQRHKYDGTITNSIVYPVTRALYGKRIRQPIGGDFGFSGELAEFYLTKDVWETDVARYGIDIWMTTTAVANGFRVCQAFLGAKIHDPKDPSSDLSAMLYQVVGSTFELMESYADVWKKVKGSGPVPIFGFQYAVGVEPVNVNIERMIERYRLGVRELKDLWGTIIPQDILKTLTKLAEGTRENFFFPEDIWVDIVYAFALAMHKRLMNKEHLLKSLTPLYLGRVASFVIETSDSDANAVEERIERLCIAFEAKKAALIDRWGD